MNFYKHHLGDYDGATAHLSWDEDTAYTRLLRVYYRREKPIPDAEKHRLARAQTRAHKAAVDSVLNEFFDLRDDGWHNKRADEELSTYQAQANTNRRIARNRKGIRTDNEPSDESCNGSCNESYNEPNTIGTPNHKPEPRTRSTPPYPPQPSAAFSRFWEAWPKGQRKQSKGVCAALWDKGKLDEKIDEIIAHVEAMKRTEDWREGYIPAPAVYLRGQRWDGAELLGPERRKVAL